MNLVEKIINEKLKKYNFFVSTFSVFSAILIISWLWDITKNFKLPFSIPEIFKNILLLVSWILLMIFFLWMWEIIIFFCQFIKVIFKNRINSIPQISKWIFQGSLDISGNSLEITSSNSGGLIKNYLYKNFKMSFNVKIINGGRFGIIFRAQNLENYLMLKIELADRKDGSGTIVYDIVPHVRFFSNFETFKIDYREPYHYLGLNYCKEEGLLISLDVKDELVVIVLTSCNETRKFQWIIPTHTESNILQRPGSSSIDTGKNSETKSSGKTEPLDGMFVPKINFRNQYGRIGFQAFGLEKAQITNLEIEKI